MEEPSSDDDSGDAAFGRVAERLQAAVAELGNQLPWLLAGRGAAEGLSEAVLLSGPAAQALRSEAIRADFLAAREAGHGELLEEVALDLLEESLREHVIHRFWERVPVQQAGHGVSDERFCALWSNQLCVGVSALWRVYTAHEELLRELGASVQKYRTSFRILFAESLPVSFVQQVHQHFRWTWRRCRARARSRRPESSEEWWWAPLPGTPAPRGMAGRVVALLSAGRNPVAARLVEEPVAEGVVLEEEPGDPELDQQEEPGLNDNDPAVQGLREVSNALLRMGLAEVWRDLVMRFAMEELGTTVEERCRSEYDSKGLLDQLAAWLYSPLLRWLRLAYGLLPVAAPQLPEVGTAALDAEGTWWAAARRVVIQFFETFVEVRIKEAFDMVRDFPDSAPALLDLRRCLARTGRSAPLVRALRQQLARRLLIAGAHTRDVIKVYIKTIKAMRLVDPRGLLLEAVSAPIRAYLKRRTDTIRCIITALTEDSDLQLELQLGSDAGRGRPAVAGKAGSVSGSAATAGTAFTAGTTGASSAAGAAGAAGTVASTGSGAGERVAEQQPATDAASSTGTNSNVVVPGVAGAPAATAAPVRAPPVEPPDFAFGGADFDASDEEEDPDAWVPDPLDADALLPSRQRRPQDVVTLLVGIYGSKEMFIKEYKEMLADRLLGNPSYSTEREMQNLELLKTRFGEAALAHCEVMLQDIKDSKRINANVQHHAKTRVVTPAALPPFRPPQRAATTNEAAAAAARHFGTPFSLTGMFGLCLSPSVPSAPSVLSAPSAPSAPSTSVNQSITAQLEEPRQLSLEQMHPLVLSQNYWPSALAKADHHPQFKLPPALEEALADYSSAYSQTRARRSLHWKRGHGLVEITVQLADRSIPVVVSPIHYAVLECFTAESRDVQLSLQEVAARLELPEVLVRKRIGFWVAKGVLREVSTGVFDVQESLSTMESAGGGNHIDEDVEHSPGQLAVRSAAGSGPDSGSAAELKVCEAFIQVVLTNAASLPLGRIHNSLQMFMTDPQYTRTEAQLRDFLGQLCQEGKLEFNGSNYSLVKKT